MMIRQSSQYGETFKIVTVICSFSCISFIQFMRKCKLICFPLVLCRRYSAFIWTPTCLTSVLITFCFSLALSRLLSGTKPWPPGKAAAREVGQWCLNQYVLSLHGSSLSGGRCPRSRVYSVTPLSCCGSLQAAAALIALKCLTPWHTSLIDLVLSLKESPHLLGG